MRRHAHVLAAAACITLGAPHLLRADDETPEQKAEVARLEKLVTDGDARRGEKAFAEAAALYKQCVNEAGKAAIPQATKLRIARSAIYGQALARVGMGEKETAVQVLALLPQLGFTDWERVAKDPAFEPLHELASWKKLLAAPTKAAAPAAAGPTRELLEGGVYRSPDGGTLVLIPQSDEWSVHRGSAGRIVFALGDLKAPTATLSLMFSTASEGSNPEGEQDLAKEIVHSLAKQLKKENAWLAAKDDGAALAVASGSKGWSLSLSGTQEKTVKHGTIAALVHGGHGVVALAWAVPASERATTAFLAKVLDAVRMGDQVPRLPKHDPRTALEGVFRGPYKVVGTGGRTVWLVADKRGYATYDESPDSAKWVDLELLYQTGERKRLSSYVFKDGVLELTPLAGGKTEKLAVKPNGDDLEVDEKHFERVDGGSMTGAHIEGRWEASSFYSAATGPNGSTGTFFASTSKHYVFHADGTFKSGAVASATLMDNPGATERHPGVISGASEVDHGTYEIKGDRLFLHYAGGKVVETTFYANRVNKDQKPPYDTSILYIAGSNYLRDKD